MHDEVNRLTRDINAINARPVEELARAYGVTSDELEKVGKAQRFAERGEQAYRAQMRRTGQAIRARGDAVRAYRAELAKTGKVEEETTRTAWLAAEQAWIQIDRRNTMKAEWEARLRAIEKARADAQRKHHDDVMRMAQAEIDSLNDLIRNNTRAADAIIADAIRRTDAEIDQLRRQEREREAAARRDGERRDREQRRADRDAERDERRRRRQERLARHQRDRGLRAPFTVVGEIGRALSGFAPRLSTGAFATIASAALIAGGAVAAASQALWLLPAAAGAAGAAMGALSLATAGFGDTIGALLAGDMDKFDAAIQRLSPNAQQAALEFRAWLPILTDVQKKVQDAFFAGTPQIISAMLQQYTPIIEKVGTGIVGAFNRGMQDVSKFLLQPDTVTQIDKISNDIVAFFNRLTPAIIPLTEAFLDIMEVGAEFLPGLADGAGNLAERFRDFIREAKESGKLKEWLGDGLKAAGEVGKIIWDLGRAFMSLAPVAEKILPYLVAAFDGLANLLTRFPALIYAIPFMLFIKSALGGLLRLGQSLGLVALSFGVTIPQAIARSRLAMAGFFATGSARTGLIGGLTAAENGLNRVQSRAGRLGSVLAGIGKFAGGATAIVGGTLVLEEVISQNMQSTAAVESYKQAAQTAADAQGELNSALLASGGAWDENARGAANSALQASLGELEAAGQSRASFLDNFRQEGKGLFDDMWHGAANGTTQAEALDAQAENNKKAFDLIKERFAGNMKELNQIVMGDQGGFDALLKNFRDLGPAGEIAASKLAEIRQELRGAQEMAENAGPVLQKLGPDVAESATKIKNAFDALPENVPINIRDVGGKEAVDLLQGLGQKILELPDGTVKLDGHLIPEVKAALEALGVNITELPNGMITVEIDPNSLQRTKDQIADVKSQLDGLVLPPITGANAPGFTPQAPPGGGGSNPLEDIIRGGAAPVPVVPLPPGAPVPRIAPPPGTPGQRDVPENPLDERGNKITDADRKKAIEEQFPLDQFKVDPWAGAGAPNVGSNGGLNVNIVGGLPGAPGGLTFPGVPGAGSPWDAIAKAESSGNWADNNSGGHMTSSGAPRGGLQITDQTWKDFGGLDFAPNAAMATREQQIEIANRIAWKGHGGNTPRGLQPWEVVSQGKVPGLSVGTTQQQFFGARGGVTGGAPGARNVTGLFGGQTTPGIDQLAQLVAQAFPGVNLGGWRPSDGPNTPTGHQRGVALDIGTQDQAMGDAINNFLRQNAGALGIKSTIWRDQWKDFKGNQSTVGGHQDHVHVEVDGQEISSAVATSLKDNMYSVNGPSLLDPVTGESGYFQVDTQALQEAGRSLQAAADRLAEANRNLAIVTEEQKQGLATASDVIEAQQKVTDAQGDLVKEQQDYAETERGKFKESEKMDYSKLPFGDPRRIMAGAITGAGGTDEDVSAILGGIMGAAAQPIGQAAGDATKNALSAFNLPTRDAPAAGLSDLVRQRNPLTPAAMAGYDVPDYTVAGGGPGAQNLLTNQGPPVDASGRMFSDTGALLDRSFTNLQAALEAKIDQLSAVMDQVKDQLTEQVLGPTVEKAVASGLEGVATTLGKTIGETAGPIIANAVAQAIPKGGNSSPGGLVQTGVGAVDAGGGAIIGGGGGQPGGFFDLSDTPGFGPLFTKNLPGFAIGGPVRGPGTPTSDSILARLSAGEWVVNAHDVQRAGGFRGMQEWTKSLPGFATGGGVIGDETVGADFFGVSQIPILGAIVNLLVRVLLKVIGVQIEVRDTLDEMSSDFRQFRGDAFQAFEASGRLMNDTSALLDRSSTSEQAAADERIRILKIVIEGIIKFIIEKLIVPIGKAVANSLIQAGAGAAGGAIGSSFPGGSIVGGMVSNVISSAGAAGVDIAAEIFTEFSLALTSVLIDMIAEGLQGVFPDLMAQIFGGDILAGMADPITALFTGLLAPILGLFTGLLGGLSLPTFDEGGLAPGVGFMPKATIRPERVLSPQQTASFDRLVDAISSGSSSSSRSTVVHAPITVLGGREAGQNVQNRLLALID